MVMPTDILCLAVYNRRSTKILCKDHPLSRYTDVARGSPSREVESRDVNCILKSRLKRLVILSAIVVVVHQYRKNHQAYPIAIGKEYND